MAVRAWWELGELLAAGLSLVGLTEARWMRLQRRYPWLACQCEIRRAWLNQRGERLWKWLSPGGYARFRFAWRQVVRRELFMVESADDLHSHITVVGLKTSQRTFTRWMDELVASGEVAAITISGRKYYGLPAKPVIMS